MGKQGAGGLLLLLLLLSRFSRIQLCVTPWTAAYQASPSLGFSRQEYWSGLPFPSPSGGLGKANPRMLHLDMNSNEVRKGLCRYLRVSVYVVSLWTLSKISFGQEDLRGNSMSVGKYHE